MTTANPPRVLISASAGSGKTYKLVHHFLGVLYNALLSKNHDRQPQVVERIVAATFTRAAAGEIVERILMRVADATIDSKERAGLSDELAAGDLGEEGCGTLLAALVARLHRLRIGTLDSFLVRSAQAFSTELGLPDSWTILDDAADEVVALEALDVILTAKAADPRQATQMLDLLVNLNQGRYVLQVRRRLVEHLIATQAALTAGPAQAWEVIGPNSDDLMPAMDVVSLAGSLATAAQPWLPRTKKGAINANWLKAITAVVEKAKDGNWEDLLKSGLLACLSDPAPSYYGAEFPPELIALVQPLRNHAAACLLQALHDRNISTRELLTEFVREYQFAKRRRSAFRFDDFTRMLLDGKVTERLADFYYRLDGQIDHILLDEFQDTSIPQWNLIRPLVEEIMSGEGAGGAGRTFFCVGDVKQTLYGWRNAEPQLLGELKDNWPDLQEQELLLSRRSSPVIIDAVNEIFSAIERNLAMVPADDEHAYLADAARAWADWFKEHDTARKDVPGFCVLRTCEQKESAAELQEAAMKLAANRVGELHEARPEAKIAILVRRRKFIAPLLAHLRQMEIPASGEGGSPLADDMAVCTVLSLLHLIDHPSDSAALFHVGASPLGQALGLTESLQCCDVRKKTNDVLKKTNELRIEILDRGLGATINGWRGRCAASCDARGFRRLGQLVALAHGYAYDGGDLRPFIDTVRMSNVEDIEASTIRVMTIHASKGRQFDFVILPDLDRRFVNQGPTVLLERPHLLADADCITNRPSPAQVAVHERLAKMDSTSKCRQTVEELCALYVALTRAQSGLEMIVHPQAGKGDGNVKLPSSPAGLLRGALADGNGEPETDLWSHQDSVLPTGRSESRPAPAASSEVKVNILPAGQPSRLRPVVAPSALEGAGKINLSRELTFAQDRGLDWGEVIHHWFEGIDWLDKPLPGDDALRASAERLQLRLSPRELNEMLRSFRDACASSAIRKLLSRDSYPAVGNGSAELELWRERPFAVPMTLPGQAGRVVVSGTMDRAVIRRAGGRTVAVDIIDYKTDAVDAKTAPEKAEFYAPQLRTYRKATATLLGIEESAITAKLAFVGSNIVVNL